MGSRLHGIALQHLLRTVVLLTVCCLSCARAQAQSFDCNKASTEVERAICNDDALGKLDVTLARSLKAAFEAEPDQRQALLADQRRWLAYRDKRCDDASTRSSCISHVYRQRIGHLQSRSIPAAAICHRLARHRWIASSQGKSAADALANEPAPRFDAGGSLESFGNPVSELPEWAKQHSPPFAVGPELIDALKSIDDGTIGHLHNLPGTNLYAITHEQGSAHCYISQFFVVEAGYARPMPTPPLIEDEGGTSCGVARGYGRIDGKPAIMQSGPALGPDMSSTEIVVLWDDDMIPSACTITSWHSSRPKAECDGSRCDELRGKLEDLSVATKLR